MMYTDAVMCGCIQHSLNVPGCFEPCASSAATVTLDQGCSGTIFLAIRAKVSEFVSVKAGYEPPKG
jgi:hypothetical protein